MLYQIKKEGIYVDESIPMISPKLSCYRVPIAVKTNPKDTNLRLLRPSLQPLPCLWRSIEFVLNHSYGVSYR